MASSSAPTSSPGTASNILTFTDAEMGYKYIEFPPDTVFMESYAQHDKFHRNVAYIPIQRHVNGSKESHLYSITAKSKNAKHICGPIMSPDGSPFVTIFGAVLDSQGMLYMCAFNRNSILGLDLTKIPKQPGPVMCQLEIPHISAPNEVAIDPANEDVLYVCGGTRGTFCACWKFNDAAYGTVYKLQKAVNNDEMRSLPTQDEDDEDDSQAHRDRKALLTKSNPFRVSVYADGFQTLAGIEVVGDDVWLAQLFDIFRLSPDGKPNKTRGIQDRPRLNKMVSWKGSDGQGNVWLADNLDVMEIETVKSSGNVTSSNSASGRLTTKVKETWLVCPAYSTAPQSVVDKVMRSSFLASMANGLVQLITACMHGEGCGEALVDPEVALSFSNTYIKPGAAPEPIRLILLHPNKQGNDETYHFEVDLRETRLNNAPRDITDHNTGKVLGQRHFFNEQVTHAAHLINEDTDQGYIVCINFEQPRVLLLKDSLIKTYLTTMNTTA